MPSPGLNFPNPRWVASHGGGTRRVRLRRPVGSRRGGPSCSEGRVRRLGPDFLDRPIFFNRPGFLDSSSLNPPGLDPPPSPIRGDAEIPADAGDVLAERTLPELGIEILERVIEIGQKVF